jgi:23S rRNA (uracil1939-C5)-methyltransferase
VNAAGDGVASAGGGTVAIPFTIPGERVRVDANGRVSILAPSPHRVTPKCAHFGPQDLSRRSAEREGGCGGCTWQHIAYPEQLRLKTALVDRLVRAAVPRAPAVRPMLPTTAPEEPWGYRHKVHFVFGNVRGPGQRVPRAAMGHFARGTRRVIPIRECPVHDARGNLLAFAFGDAFARAGVAAADERRRGTLRSLAIRVGFNTPEMMATLVVTDDGDRTLRAATRRAIETAIEPPTALHLNVHPRDNGFIFGTETRKLSGPARMREAVHDVSFVVSPTAFFQTNVRAAELLVTHAMAAIPDAAHVLDLYAGAGLFALPLARRGHKVVAIEENRQAVADGEASARLNRIPADRCRFIARRVEAALDGVAGAEAMVLDPPREGCAPAVLQRAFGRLRPSVAVYVSCNPEALARDLAAIVRHGYTIQSLQPVDMFPHTAHVETVVVLTR